MTFLVCVGSGKCQKYLCRFGFFTGCLVHHRLAEFSTYMRVYLFVAHLVSEISAEEVPNGQAQSTEKSVYVFLKNCLKCWPIDPSSRKSSVLYTITMLGRRKRVMIVCLMYLPHLPLGVSQSTGTRAAIILNLIKNHCVNSNFVSSFCAS